LLTNYDIFRVETNQKYYAEIPSYEIVSKWPKLRVLTMWGYFLTDEHAKVIQEGLPQIA